jgi:pimeloyl-ACP methyl ester carboxylesterase
MQNRFSPLLFFHGLAPAASTVYLPIVLYGLCRSGEYQHRPIFFFENKNISYGMTFTPVFDEATAAESVAEALEAHGYFSNDWQRDVSSSSSSKPIHISVCGHSFGSCVVTWLLRSPKTSHLIKNVVLLDPVSILLSEPDVMNNFLYKPLPELIRKGTLFDFAIFFVSRTEVFTEHYLRRHFTWYNSELWLEDLQNYNVKLLIGLSGKDEIVNARKVQEEIETLNSEASMTQNKVRLIYWPKSGHASCIMDSSLWNDLRSMFELQESEINKLL